MPSQLMSPSRHGPDTGVGDGVSVGGSTGTLGRKFATVEAVLFSALALYAGWNWVSGTPTGRPLKVTLGFEKYCIRGQKALHELWYAIIVAKALPVPMWPWLKVNGELSVGSWNQSCRAPMLWPVSWPKP